MDNSNIDNIKQLTKLIVSPTSADRFQKCEKNFMSLNSHLNYG